MIIHDVDLCPHGYARSWDIEADPDETLPEIENCPICDRDATSLDAR